MSYIDFLFAGMTSALVAACCYLTLRHTSSDDITTVDIDVGIVAFCIIFIAAMLVQESNVFSQSQVSLLSSSPMMKELAIGGASLT